MLGLGPAPEYTFLAYASPVGNYFKVNFMYHFKRISDQLTGLFDYLNILIQEGSAPLNLYIEEEFVRAAPGGAGGVKAMSNYAPVSEFSPTLVEKLVVVVISSTPEFHQESGKLKLSHGLRFLRILYVFTRYLCLQVLKALIRAKSRGFSDVLYLDSVNRKNVEEVSSCNIFVVKVLSC